MVIYNSSNLTAPFEVHPKSKKLWQLGAYFGYTVVGADLNGDSLDELIVSAPLYTDGLSSYDQGRVFVFWNNKNNPGVEEWVSCINLDKKKTTSANRSEIALLIFEIPETWMSRLIKVICSRRKNCIRSNLSFHLFSYRNKYYADTRTNDSTTLYVLSILLFSRNFTTKNMPTTFFYFSRHLFTGLNCCLWALLQSLHGMIFQVLCTVN